MKLRRPSYPVLTRWLIAVLAWSVVWVSPVIGSADKTVIVERQAYLMGTRARLVTLAKNRTGGLQRLERILSTLEGTERDLSTWRDDSFLSQLNRHPVTQPWHAPPSVCRLFQDLVGWHYKTSGAFDPGIGSLIDLWGRKSGGRLPSAPTVESAFAQAGLRHFSLHKDSCTVTRTINATLDAGAFGKGAALDRVVREEQQRGATAWLVDLGGQIAVSNPSSLTGWPVAVSLPSDRETAAFELRLTYGSIAVSGGSERDYWLEDEPVGHILDPRTGHPVNRNNTVVVWHPKALDADVLATALYVMGLDEGLPWATSMKIAACFIGSPVQSPLFRESEFDFYATPTFEESFPGVCTGNLATPIFANP